MTRRANHWHSDIIEENLQSPREIIAAGFLLSQLSRRSDGGLPRQDATPFSPALELDVLFVLCSIFYVWLNIRWMPGGDGRTWRETSLTHNGNKPIFMKRRTIKLSEVLRKFVCVAAAAFCIAGFVVSTIIVSDRKASAEAVPAQAPATDNTRKSECTLRLAQFVEELDLVLDTANSILPVEDLFKKYFPLSGCDMAQVFEACRKSRYFGGTNGFSVAFGSSRLGIPLYVQIDFDKKTGNSNPPFVIIYSF